MKPLSEGREIAPGVRVAEHLHRSNQLDVYAARCARRGCSVVVKTPRPDRLRDRAVVAALLREGRLLKRLAHPHIVRGYDVQRAPRPAVVLETVGGETLAHLLHRTRLAAPDLSELARQLAGALGYLHAEGVLHLDHKPSNVIGDAGRAKLLDLSIAQRPGRIRAGRGTWGNMAPEQARGGQVTAATDVWGLGTVLYEGATGRGPFADRDQCAARADRVRGLPRALAATIDACLQPDPAERPALAELLAL
jgi:serine/threonine protein kinase